MGSVHPRGVSTPTGSSRDRACRAGSLRTAALLALSLPFRGPSQHPRTVPSGPEGPNRGRCFLPWAFVPHDTCRNGGPVRARGFRPRTVPRPGFGYPPRGVHHRPSRRLAAPERPSASPFKAFSSRRSGLLSEAAALVALLASIRLAPLGSVRTRSASGPRSRRECVRSAGSRRTRRVAAFLGFTLQSVPPLRPRAPAFPRGASPRTHGGGSASRSTCVSGSCGTEGSVGPSRGYRLSWDLSPCDRRGDVPVGARGGLMSSPHGAQRCMRRAPIRAPSRPTRPAQCADPSSAVHR